MTIVVDASVAVKWFFPEIHAEAARRLLKSQRRLIVPDLIWAEVGNTILKKFYQKEITLEEASDILKDFRRFPLQIYSSRILLDSAWDIARSLKITFYDSLYLALALDGGSTVVTADLKFYNALKGHPLSSAMVWIEDVK